jgi:deazaflavin-dependent oxidoreductase (nitroreductase family)
MLRSVVRFFGVLSFLLAGAGVVAVIGMRRKWPPVLDALRMINRRTKPIVLASAGQEGAYASVVKHAGRSSGRLYETPVVAAATEDGFVIALPYGSNTDWLKNVLAQGSATIVTGGSAYEVDQPKVIGLEEAAPYFQARDRRMQRQFGVAEWLRLRRITDRETGPASEHAVTGSV